MGYFDFKPDKEVLICIDSDGCAMDTMSVKHYKCFGPEYVKSYGFESFKEEALEYCNRVNLFSRTRGINRFKGLAIALREMSKRHHLVIEGLEGFEAWTVESSELSNPALLAKCQIEKNDCMEKALLWSIHVNQAIAMLPKNSKPFGHVKETMDEMCKEADVVAVSSANAQAVEDEWTKHQLKADCRSLLCQEAGSKAFCIEKLMQKGYSRKKALMVGDALGDYKAAQKNGIWFYPIIAGSEEMCWKRLKEETCVRLIEGTFDETYQEQLLRAFEAVLVD